MLLLEVRPANVSSLHFQTVRVGLVGCGRWGTNILRDLVSLGLEVLAVEHSPENARRAEEGGAAVVQSCESLSGVDGIIVATPTATHAQVVAEVLTLGVPVFVEKPLCVDAEEAAALAALSGSRLFVMDKWRYHPGVERLRELARDGSLGVLQGVRTVRRQWGSPHEDVDPVWILAPHDLSIGLEVLGTMPLPLAAVVQSEGPLVTGLVGLLGPQPWLSIDVGARSPSFERRVEVHGSEGVAVLGGGWDDFVEVHRGASGSTPVTERIPVGDELPLRRELLAFIEYLQGGQPPRSSAAEGALIVATLARLRELAGIS